MGLNSILQAVFRPKRGLVTKVGLVGAGFFLVLIRLLWGADEKSPAADASKKELIKSPFGALIIERSVFAQKAQLGTVASLEWRRFPQDSEATLLAVGDRGAVYFRPDGTPISTVKFEHPGVWMAPVTVKGRKDCEYMNRGGDRQQVGFYDSEGRIVWQFGLRTDPIPENMAAGDLSGDGKPEFAVGMAEAGGLRLLDLAGREKWRQPELRVWHVEIADPEGNGQNEIVYSNSQGRLCIRSVQGQLLREIPTEAFVGFFSICRWPDSSGKWCLINNNKREGVQLLDFQGKIVATFFTPDRGQQVFGTPARLEGAKKPYFALVVCDCVPQHDSRFYVFNSEGNLVFTEKLFSSRAATVTIPGSPPGTEDLLLGEADGKIWRYHLEQEK